MARHMTEAPWSVMTAIHLMLSPNPLTHEDLIMTGPKTDETTRRDCSGTRAGWPRPRPWPGWRFPQVHAGEDNTIKLAIVGCGGRGTGAVGNALSVPGENVKLIAMADLFAGSPGRLAQAAQGPVRGQGRRPARPAIPGLRRVPEGDRLPEAGRRRAA